MKLNYAYRIAMKASLLFLSYVILRRRRWTCYPGQFQESVLMEPRQGFQPSASRPVIHEAVRDTSPRNHWGVPFDPLNVHLLLWTRLTDSKCKRYGQWWVLWAMESVCCVLVGCSCSVLPGWCWFGILCCVPHR